MDWMRLQRAWEAERMVEIEQRHHDYLNEQVKALSEKEWEAITEHNRLLKEFYGEP